MSGIERDEVRSMRSIARALPGAVNALVALWVLERDCGRTATCRRDCSIIVRPRRAKKSEEKKLPTIKIASFYVEVKHLNYYRLLELTEKL